MAAFWGHCLAGVIFVTFGVSWMIQMSIRYFKCLKNKTQFKSTFRYQCDCLFGGNFPVESVYKTFIAMFAVSVQLFTGFEEHLFVHMNDSHHSTMYFFLVIAGFIDLMMHYRVPLPEGTDYIACALAFGVEALLFYFHVHGRSPLNAFVHRVLVVLACFNTICLLLDMRFSHNFLAAAFRAFCMFLQGTWIFHVAFILFNPFEDADKWNEYDPRNIYIATMMFTWHIGLDIVILMAITGIVGCFSHKS